MVTSRVASSVYQFPSHTCTAALLLVLLFTTATGASAFSIGQIETILPGSDDVQWKSSNQFIVNSNDKPFGLKENPDELWEQDNNPAPIKVLEAGPVRSVVGVTTSTIGTKPPPPLNPPQSENQPETTSAARAIDPSPEKAPCAECAIKFPVELHFAVNNADLSLDAIAVLDTLPTNKQYLVVGYTDSNGSKELNAALAIKRSKSVQLYLASKGKAASSDSAPLCCYKNSHAESRRVVITVISKPAGEKSRN